ncbi:MAG: hypothetical protein HXX20_02130 [Chloroflexi bacterium]|nr:hypothetical protein [Chloroflexota bacterium]
MEVGITESQKAHAGEALLQALVSTAIYEERKRCFRIAMGVRRETPADTVQEYMSRFDTASEVARRIWQAGSNANNHL